MSTPDKDTRRNRNRQLVLFSAIAAAALAVFAFWLAAGGGKTPAPRGGIEAELAGPGTAEESWIRRSETRIGVIETRLREMEAKNRRLERDNAGLQDQLRMNAENARNVIDSQAAALEEQRRRDAPAVQGDGFLSGANTPRTAVAARPAPAVPSGPMMLEFELDGDPAGGAPGIVEKPQSRPLGVWLPAGSHAEAVVLAGVDASASVASQGDPRPVLLRLTGPAYSAAADGRALTVDVAGCTVTGAAYGDLSSEKVYARLRTLTCAGPEPDSVIETRVAGFVAGAGKAGVRGPVVSREGALVEKAFLAGLVSGIGQGVAGAFQPQAVATGGVAAVANTGLADIGRAGLGAGASSAGRKVSDYLIRRAEQYQPVIQLTAGTRVTVVFIEGARIDGRTEANREKKND